MAEIILIDDGITNAALDTELKTIPKSELWAMGPHGADEVELDGRFTLRELLLLALKMERTKK